MGHADCLNQANIFMLFAPLEGWRHVEVTDRHTAVDYAHLLKEVSDTWFPNAPKIGVSGGENPRINGASSFHL